MKPKFLDERDTSSQNPNSPLPPTMFSKFHQSQHQPPAPPPPQLHHPQPTYHHLQPPPPHGYHHFHFAKDSQTSEEADSSAAAAPAPAAAAATPTPPPKKSKPAAGADDGGETIEAVRRPRGRPPGSKNKPKPPMVVTREPDAPSMSPYILEIPAGADVVDSLVRLARRRGIGLCVLSGSGAVANVSLRQPTSALVPGPAGGGTITFHGRFELVSLSAVLLPGGAGLADSQPPSLALPLGGYNGNSSSSDNGGFTVSLSAPQGHIMGGKVAGPLTAAGTVYVVAASFNNPTFHKLPLADEDDGGGGGGGQVGSPAVSGSGGEASADGGGAMYTCHMGGADVIWAPTAARPVPY